MTRYHASLIPLCQIEEPPTFYEGMDDHPPVETDNDDNDSFFLDDRDRDNKERDSRNSRDNRATDEAIFFPLTKPHQPSKQQQHLQHQQQQILQQQTTTTTVAGDAINFNHHHHHHDHEHYSQEFLQGPEQDDNNNRQELHGQHQNNNDRVRHQFHRLSNSNNHPESDHHSAIESPSCQRDLLSGKNDSETSAAAAASVTKHQRRRERTLGSSGEQIFFYDGPNLMHAKLYSDRLKGDTMSEGMAGTSMCASPGTATATIHSQEPPNSNKSKANNSNVHATTTALPVAAATTVVSSSTNGQAKELQQVDNKQSALSQSAVQPQHIANTINNNNEGKSRPRSRSRSRSRTRSRSRSRSRSVTRNSHTSSRSRSRSRSTASGAWSRTMSESLIRKEQNLFHQQPSSFPSAKTRPSILTRGFSADSNSRQDYEQRGSQTGNGSVTGSANRKATAKERFVALVTRSNGASTPVQNSKDTHGGSGTDGSSPLKGGGGRRSSADDRSPILAQTHHRRQGSPSLSRTGRMEYSSPTASSTSPPSADANLGFPYNNSSLLMSSDFARTAPTNKSNTLRSSRGNGKPRPFSVATMEKLISSNSQTVSGRGGGSGPKQESSQQEKQNGGASVHDRLETPANERHHAHHHHSHSNSGIGLHHHHQHRQSSVPITSHSKGQEHGSLRSRMTGSGSHPLLTSFGTPVEASMVSPAEGVGSGDARRRSVAGKGKEVERFHDREQGFKLVKTTYSESITDDLSNSDGAGAGGVPPPLHLHEHHIHYHYYCQHCPPLSQSNLDDIGEMEDCYGDRLPTQVLRHSEGTIADAAAAARPIRRNGGGAEGSAEFCTSPIDFGRHGFAPIGSPLEDPMVPNATAVTTKKNKKKSILGTMTMTSSMRRRFFAEQNQEQKQQQQQQQSQSPMGLRAGNSNGNNFYDRGQQQAHGTQRHQVSPILTMGFEKSDGRGGYGSSFATMRGKLNQRRRVSLAGLTDQFFDADDDEDEQQRRRRQQHLEFYHEYEDEFGTSSNEQQQQQLQSSPSPDGTNPQQQRAKFLSRLKQFLLRPSPFAKNYSSPPPPPASAPANNNGNLNGTSSRLPSSSSSSSSAFMTGVGNGSTSNGMQDVGTVAAVAGSRAFTSQRPSDI
ncbi:hypothetical protein BG015_005692 [Linnemannia schmuckeri]|uniref:Uncharacterized protein n=1 Tax=Linnemannia schmuckeri TaxID=64567 RepID=A0A9P5S0R1_9FUNG|nr:hypothetical protein BG015_005692 [Linnemannia schmuckeri]